MKLYLAQHGDSLPEQVNPERPLSERGWGRHKDLSQSFRVIEQRRSFRPTLSGK